MNGQVLTSWGRQGSNLQPTRLGISPACAALPLSYFPLEWAPSFVTPCRTHLREMRAPPNGGLGGPPPSGMGVIVGALSLSAD